MTAVAAPPRLSVRAVSPTTLPQLWPLLAEFAATRGADGQGPEALMQLCYQRLSDPSFLVVMLLDESGPVGFAAAQIGSTPTGREVFILTMYAQPGLSVSAGRTLDAALCLWGRANQAVRIGARTVRQADGQLSEERAWRRNGYQPESVLVYKEL